MDVYYITKEEIRWDQLALLGYGDANRMTDLLEANPNIAVYNWVPARVIVTFPIILDAATNPLPSSLPAWK